MSTISKLANEVGEPLFEQLVEIFLQESQQHFTELSQQINHSDLKEAIRLSHSIKSSAKTYGAEQLAELATLIESACMAGKPEEALRHWSAFAESFKQTQQAMFQLEL